MSHPRLTVALAALGSTLALALTAPPLAEAAQSVVQAASPLAQQATPEGATPAATPVEFTVGLTPADQAGAEALAQAVSTPGGPSYRRFLTPAEWEKRFSPKASTVNAVKKLACRTGDDGRIGLGGPALDRGLGERGDSRARVRHLAATVPPPWQEPAARRHGADRPHLGRRPDLGRERCRPATRDARAHPRGRGRRARRCAGQEGSKEEIPQPEGFRNAPPCSGFYGEKLDLTDPAFGAGYPSPLPYAPCGYTPPQFQSAYGLAGPIGEGVTGAGVTVAIVDAYASPTLLADAQQYATLNQPGQPLSSGQFSELLAPKFNQIEACEANEWYGEQTLDVEAVHATAPGANILYVGAKNCGTALNKAVQQVVDGHLADVITDSWSEDGGDLFEPPGARRSFDNVLLMAAGTGIGVLFSSGDEGDEFITFGENVADYPTSSPLVTAVGGTSLQAGAAGERLGELGWSTSKGALCTAELAAEKECPKGKVGQYIPKAPGEYLYGSGGMTSFVYGEPVYQEGVVPPALAERNSAVTRTRNRVLPDISMDGDPTTGHARRRDADLPRRRLLRPVPDRRDEPVLAVVRGCPGARRTRLPVGRSASSTRCSTSSRGTVRAGCSTSCRSRCRRSSATTTSMASMPKKGSNRRCARSNTRARRSSASRTASAPLRR